MSTVCGCCEQSDKLVVLPPGMSGRQPQTDAGKKPVLFCHRCDG